MAINIVFKEISIDVSNKLSEMVDFIKKNIITNPSDIDWDIYFLNLNEKEEIHNNYMKTPYPGNNAYRAITHTKFKKTFIFINEGETIDSLCWVLAHELGHINILHNDYINAICKNNYYQLLENYQMKYTDYESRLGDDEFHDSLLEEQICNALATSFIGKDYGRDWWRKQL